MRLNIFGRIIRSAWFDLPHHYPYIQLDAFCIMPNHVHGIILIQDSSPSVGAGLNSQPSQPEKITSTQASSPDLTKTRPYNPGNPNRLRKRHPLSEIVRAFKSFSARRINAIRKTYGEPVWQRDYFEHIIRDDANFDRIYTYILNNPHRWLEDRFHPSNLSPESN